MGYEFKPMLAAPANYDFLPAQFPMYASPKLDGVRAVVREGKLMTRSLKPVANIFIQHHWSMDKFNGLDGEFILGSCNDPDAFRITNSALSRIDGAPLMFFHAFDYINTDMEFPERLAMVHQIAERENTPYLQVVPQTIVNNLEELETLEAALLSQGFEGVMLRIPQSGYKYGRSTAAQGWLLKVKRFTDADAIIIEVIEKMHNGNSQVLNALGYAERSSHKANMVPMGTMGALRVKDTISGVEFNVGTGFTSADCMEFWINRVEYVGRVIKYKSQPTGVKDKPRFPVFMGMRSDM